ncbi:hypothetical protein HZA97_05570 [Candidatus Woesearchaeota archaeon]|nr:hypothetical protein [Candidatus Woesearchaeota archaeon]
MTLEQFLEEEDQKLKIMYNFSVYFLTAKGHLTGLHSEVKNKIDSMKKAAALISSILKDQKTRIKKLPITSAETIALANLLKKQTNELIELYHCLASFETEEDYEDETKIANIQAHIESCKPTINQTRDLLLAIKLTPQRRAA